MAKYKTDAEAQQDLSRQLQEKAAELRPIYDSTDRVLKEKADKLKVEIGKIQNQLMMTGSVGALGGGLASGITSLGTGLLDLGALGINALTKSKVGMASEWLMPGVESVSKEQAGLFGAGKGIGSSLGLSKVLSALNIGSNITDETMFNGVPVTQILTAIGSLTQAGYKAGKNWQENRGVKKIIEQLGPDGESTLKQFMLRGQDSSDPRVSGIVAKLRTNPDYAEFFNVLEKQATAEATKGARVVTPSQYAPEGVGSAVYQAIDGKVQQLRENITALPQSKFDAAKKMGGNNDILFTNKTVERIDGLLDTLTKQETPDAEAAVRFLGRFKDSIAGQKISVEKMQALLGEFGSQAKQGESLITDVSVGTQKRLASAIFGGLKDDLADTAQNSTVPRIREISRILDSARNDVKKGYDAYESFIAQGLPAKLKDKTISSVDPEEMLQIVKGLTNAQRDTMAGILQSTAPDDLKRIKQVMYDDFVQSARTTLPDNTPGVDLKLLATKFNKATESERKSMAFALGTSLDDFTEKMKDAQNFFNYQQKYAGVPEARTVAQGTVDTLSSAAAVAAGYGAAKATSLSGRVLNALKGGLSDENMFNFLASSETKNLLRDSITNPNSVKTLDKVTRVLGGRNIAEPLTNAMQQGYRGATEAVQRAAPTAPQAPTEAWDIGPATEATPSSGEPWDVGPASSVSPQDIEQQIRSEAQRQGYGQYADLFVRQAKQESGFNPYAVSKAGAQGVFQLMPGTAKDLGVSDPFDVNQNISGGINYMGQQLNRFKDPALALAAYNAGPKRVADAGGIPNIAETQDYVKKILGS